MANSEEETKKSGLASDADARSDSKSSGDGPQVGAKRKSTESLSTLPSKKITFGLKKSGDQLSSNDKNKGQKITMGFGGVKKPAASVPIKMNLSCQKPAEPTPVLKPTSKAVANVFNADDESDEEEMPAEAKMRMRNVGRFTATAAGPNSFGKGGLGFCDRRKMKERELLQKSDELCGDK